MPYKTPLEALTKLMPANTLVLFAVIVTVTAAPGPYALLSVVPVVDAVDEVGVNSAQTFASGLTKILKLFKL